MIRSALPASREARRILVGTLLSAVGRGLTLPFLYVYLTEVRGLDGRTVGLLVGWMGVVALALAPYGGTLVDRFGARRVVLPLFLVEAVGTGSLALVDSTLTAWVSLTVIAVGGAALWSGQNTILATLVAPEERQKTFGLSFTLLNLGIGLGGVIAGFLVDADRPGTFQTIYVLDACSYLMPALILLSLPKVGQRVVAAVTQTPTAAGGRSRGGYREVLRDRRFVQFFLFGLVLTTFGYAQVEIGYTAFSTRVADVEPSVLGWAFAGNTLVIVVAQLFVLRWLEGRSRTVALAIAGGIFAASWAVLAVAGIAGSRGVVGVAIGGVVACTVIFAMGETLLSPVMPAITNALASDELRGRYNALASMVWGLSGVVGPVVAGPLIGGGLGSVWIALVIGGCAAASVLALRLRGALTPEQDGRAPAETPPTPRHPTGQAATGQAATGQGVTGHLEAECEPAGEPANASS